MEQINDKYYITYTEYGLRKVHKNSLENLTPFNTLTPERQKEIAIKGNKASILARNKNKLTTITYSYMFYIYDINYKLNRLAQKKHVKRDNLFNEENCDLYTKEEIKELYKISKHIEKYKKDIAKAQAKINSLENCMS